MKMGHKHLFKTCRPPPWGEPTDNFKTNVVDRIGFVLKWVGGSLTGKVKLTLRKGNERETKNGFYSDELPYTIPVLYILIFSV